MSPRVAVVTDSTSCLSGEAASAHGIRVVPLHVVADGAQRDERELSGLTDDELAAFFAEHKRLGTSRPSPAVLLAAYEQAAAEGADAVVSVHLSGGLSGTVDAAILAASRSSVPVEVVDSRSAGMALGYAVLSAARAASHGATSPQVAAVALGRADDATVSFYVDNLEQLRRGGRIGAAAHLLGSALAIKPILTLEDGVISPRAKVRTATKALDRLVADSVAAVEEAAFGADVCVQDLGAGERAEQVRTRLTQACPGVAVDRAPLGPVLGAHVGPGTLAVVVSPRPAPTSVAG